MVLRAAVPGLLLVGALAHGAESDDAAARLADLPPATRALVTELTTCAAYFFNATNASPMHDYDLLYRAGERAFNRAAHILGRAAADRLMGDAAVTMTALTGGDWTQFARVRARYGPRCAGLADPTPATD